MTVLSLGAGVQSSTIVVLAREGMLPDDYLKIDAAIFADTGSEPSYVYDWLEDLKFIAGEAGIGLIVESENNTLLEEQLEVGRYRKMIPAYTLGGGMIRRQCTYEYKIKPVRRAIRKLLNRQSGKNAHVDVCLGITTDEAVRMKDSDVDWIHNRYPLIDMGWSRQDCLDFMDDLGYEPPRSSCIFCPYRGDDSWKHLRDNDYEGYLKAVDLDHALQSYAQPGIPSFLHRSRLPLENVDLEAGNPEGFGNECSGFCGV